MLKQGMVIFYGLALVLVMFHLGQQILDSTDQYAQQEPVYTVTRGDTRNDPPKKQGRLNTSDLIRSAGDFTE